MVTGSKEQDQPRQRCSWFAVFAWHENPWYHIKDAQGGRHVFLTEVSAERYATTLNNDPLAIAANPRGYVVRPWTVIRNDDVELPSNDIKTQAKEYTRGMSIQHAAAKEKDHA